MLAAYIYITMRTAVARSPYIGDGEEHTLFDGFAATCAGHEKKVHRNGQPAVMEKQKKGGGFSQPTSIGDWELIIFVIGFLFLAIIFSFSRSARGRFYLPSAANPDKA